MRTMHAIAFVALGVAGCSAEHYWEGSDTATDQAADPDAEGADAVDPFDSSPWDVSDWSEALDAWDTTYEAPPDAGDTMETPLDQPDDGVMPAAGRMVVVGHDYYDTNAAADDVIGNAVFLAESHHVMVLAYAQYSDSEDEVVGLAEAIEQRRIELGRGLTYTILMDHTLLGAGTYDLAAFDVLLIAEQETATAAILQSIGEVWASRLEGFLASGGVIVVSDGHYASGLAMGGGSTILYSAGLMDTTATEIYYTEAANLAVVAPSHPLAAGLPSTYTSPNSTTCYGPATSWEVVVADPSGNPCVLTWPD